ncbi:hypothetical protein [Deinococcus humi]|uniref:Uncharacterized protein n=1 Tax=Deinococcus humi TaxID=662880 RepID=A0A7W8JUQ5_9DEIO|nr:hypothetical protein [Deinococcus humi]MBB5363531.1 hypothetical protein [Deinococcus humi]
MTLGRFPQQGDGWRQDVVRQGLHLIQHQDTALKPVQFAQPARLPGPQDLNGLHGGGDDHRRVPVLGGQLEVRGLLSAAAQVQGAVGLVSGTAMTRREICGAVGCSARAPASVRANAVVARVLPPPVGTGRRNRRCPPPAARRPACQKVWNTSARTCCTTRALRASCRSRNRTGPPQSGRPRPTTSDCAAGPRAAD